MSIKDFLSNTSLLLDVMVGFTNITFSELFNLKYGTIIEFNKLAGETLDIFINDYDNDYKVYVYSFRKGDLIYSFVSPDSGGNFEFYSIAKAEG